MTWTIGPGEDEELPQPHGDRPPSWPRRAAGTVAAAVAILLVGYLVVRGLSDAGHHPRSADATGGPSETASATPTPLGGYGTGAPDSGSGLLGGLGTITGTVGVGSERQLVPILAGGTWVPIGRPLPVPAGPDPGQCPVPVRCSSTPGLPAVAVAPLGNVLLAAAQTVRLVSAPWRGQLWFRQINGLLDDAELVIRVQPAHPGARPSQGVTPDQTITFAQVVQHGYLVSVQLGTGRPGTAARLVKLAGDSRLLAV